MPTPMTARQQAIQDDVQKLRKTILAGLPEAFEGFGVGHSIIFRMATKWGDGMLGSQIEIRKLPAGYEWREYGLGCRRKGFTAPAWRPL